MRTPPADARAQLAAEIRKVAAALPSLAQPLLRLADQLSRQTLDPSDIARLAGAFGKAVESLRGADPQLAKLLEGALSKVLASFGGSNVQHGAQELLDYARSLLRP